MSTRLAQLIRWERIWDLEYRGHILWASGLITVGIACADWVTKPYLSLGFLYLFPIMLASAFLPRWGIVAHALLCAGLSDQFSLLEPSLVRSAFESLALVGCGLFVSELIRNRRLSIATQMRFKALVETSPAAIVTVDERGIIDDANQAATRMLTAGNGGPVGAPIAAFVPELHHGLRRDESPEFRASMHCRAHRANGETFEAEVWFSTYKVGQHAKLAAIIADVSEEYEAQGEGDDSRDDLAALTIREIDVIRFVVQGLSNKEIAGRMEFSERTVKNTMQQLFSKTGARNRAQLVRAALESYRDIL